MYKATIPIEAGASDGEQKSILKSILKRPERILSLIRRNPYVTKNEMASTLNLSVPAISKQLAKLKDNGLIRREGPDNGGYWVILNL